MERIEKRLLEGKAECRAVRTEDDEYRIEGFGIRFETMSKDLGGFFEVIDSNALANTDMSDVLVRVNHGNDIGNVVGRSGVNLTLEVRAEGLWYSVLLDPESARDMQLYRDIKRGLIKSSSFAFIVREDGDEIQRIDDVIVRTVKDIEILRDVAPVHNPAYEEATVDVRSLEKVNEFKKDEAERSKEDDDSSNQVKEALNVDDTARLRLLNRKK